LVNTNQYDRKDDGLFKHFANADYIRPRDGIKKDARKGRLTNIMPGSRPGIIKGISTKMPVGLTQCGRWNVGYSRE